MALLAVLGLSSFAQSGQSYWITNGGGDWTNPALWDAAGGTPGLNGALSLNDTATFDIRGLNSGTATVTLNTNAELSSLTISNASASYVISGSGTITLQAGSNQPTLNNFAGSHTITTTVNILTNLTVNNTAGSILTINAQVNNNSTGTNTLLTQNGSGTLVLGGNSGNTGLGLVANAGTTILAKTGNKYALYEIRALNEGATVLYGGNNQIAIGSAITNYGKVRMTGGTLDLNGYSDTINTVTDGTGAYDSTGTGTITSSSPGGSLTIGQIGSTTRPSTFGGTITGSLALVMSNSSTLTLTGNNNYTGGTLINTGSLIVGTNGTTGTLGSGNVTNNANLVFNRSNDYLVGNLISGTGSLTQVGAGTITLTQNNTYTGGTTITNNGGIVTQNAGALGTGAVNMFGGNLKVQSQSLQISSLVWNGGVIALPHAGSGIYLVSAGALSLVGIGTFDLTDATISHGVKTALLSASNMASFDTNNFTADVTGTYSLLIEGDTLWIYLLNNPDSIPPDPVDPAYPNFVIPGLTPNQLQVAGAMNKWASNNPAGDQAIVLGALTNIPSSEWAAAYDQMSARYYQQMSTIAFNLANAQNNELVQRMFGLRVAGTGFSMSGFADNMAILEGQGDGKSVSDHSKDILRPGADTLWGMFVDGNGMFGSANSGSMLPNYNFQSGGITTGLTYQWSDTFLTGLYAGYQ